ncbi:hypothetical protein FRC09_002290 [Ceratobasidium sp. 395]|nr:hypothetical protein FRC09_002290 [Ceratobasidium sp. 395]
MTRKQKTARTTRTPKLVSEVTASTFTGLNVLSDGSEPAIRNAPPPQGKSYDRKRQLARDTLRKTENDMTRAAFKAIEEAMDNAVTLPIRISDLEASREGGKIPLAAQGPFRGLAGHETRLDAKRGSTAVVDLDGEVMFWYFPGLLGSGLRANLLRCLADLVAVYRPPTDDRIRDRRAARSSAEAPFECSNGSRVSTRSQAARSKAAAALVMELDDAVQEPVDETEDDLGLPDAALAREHRPEMYVQDQGEVRLQGATGSELDPAQRQDPTTLSGQAAAEPLEKLPPFAYYFSPGWYQTGMHNVRPIQMSLHLREALAEGSARQLVGLFEAKRLYDKQMALMTRIINRPLSEGMLAVRGRMTAVKGPTQTAVVNGWTSAFPCFGIGINRTSALHRDTRGIRRGLDIIGVLGTFTTGGDLELPDLNLRAEWKPGCVGAFDGYDLRHRVAPWSGGSRVALISFCRQSTWSGLGLDSTLPRRPTLAECRAHLSEAREARSEVVQQLLVKQRAKQAARDVDVSDPKYTARRSAEHATICNRKRPWSVATNHMDETAAQKTQKRS